MNIDLILVMVLLTNLSLLASGRLGTAIRITALQGLILGLLPLSAYGEALTWRIVVLAVGSMAVKGVAFPLLLFRALREADIGREMQPFVGPVGSALIGLLSLTGAFALGARMPALANSPSALLMPVAMFSIFIGLFLLVARRRAVSQVIGFLIMENGIYVFAIGALEEVPLLVDLGLLLDVFVAVFVMGIAVFHINREFDHLDADKLASLKG